MDTPAKETSQIRQFGVDNDIIIRIEVVYTTRIQVDTPPKGASQNTQLWCQ